MKSLSLTERIEMHGESYVARYEGMAIDRIRRLMRFVELGTDFAVADFGCGNAMLADCVCGKIERYDGVDFSPRFVEAAKERCARLGYRNVQFYCGSIQEFCARHPGEYDACFALDLSEHVPDREWADIVAAMFSCLKPGGTAYLHTPNLEFFVERMKAANFVLKQFPEHIAVRGPAENVGFFHAAGFEATRLRFLPHYNVLRLVHPLSFLPGIGRHLRARLFISARRPRDARP